jgi:4-oxalocrotonate tautomerase
MPLVRIALLAGQPEAHKKRVADAIHRALVETIKIPSEDRFQIVTEHAKADFIYDPHYLKISRTDALVMVQITISTGRSTEVKKALFRRIAELLTAQAGIRREDVLVNLIEVAKENWSFGNGEAQYAG